ncbi:MULTISPECIES: hypothetical protein [Geobacillus]|jgi:hypothetical protein|nr:hypothetical protein [Geobacillus stearothermophilus]MED4871092.1 hypothetical protein [Geobacillus stearothermophilus]MED4984998.1 hypothetical protein [Geobacillus stearothermophilus]
MSTITTFDSTVESLLDLLESIQECRTQLLERVYSGGSIFA